MPTCAACEGKGVVFRLRDENEPKGSCARCGGEGWGWDGHDGHWTCPDCRGGGTRITCSACAGTGHTGARDETPGNCPECSGSGFCWDGTDGHYRCPRCHGSGSV